MTTHAQARTRLTADEIEAARKALEPQVNKPVAARAADGTAYTRRMLWVRSLDSRLGRTYELLVAQPPSAEGRILVQINREVFVNDAAFLAGVVECYLHPPAEPVPPEPPKPIEYPAPIEAGKGVLP